MKREAVDAVITGVRRPPSLPGTPARLGLQLGQPDDRVSAGWPYLNRHGRVVRTVDKRPAPTQRQHLSIFDRFAEAASEFASHAVFFIGCALVVVLWLPSYFIIGNLNTWQLIINTMTTIITFLLVALLQNTQRRSEQAVHLKLDALAEGLADLVASGAGNRDSRDDFGSDIEELRAAVGAEQSHD